MTNGAHPHHDPVALPARSTTVIVGGGVMGVSTAYHLAALGHTDVVLLEQGRLSCGTTWHAAGLVGQLRASQAMSELITYSAGLYARLEAQTGLATGWRSCGSVQVARTPARMEVLRRTVSRAAAAGVHAEFIDGIEAGRLWPLMRVDDLRGAVWVPGDGRADPSDVTASLARGARQHGIRIVERVRVEAIDVRDGRARAVRTDRGVVECDTVVICAGQWSKQVGRMAGVAVPLHSAEHFYAVTQRIDGVAPDLPVLRDPDGRIYFKEETGGLVMGGFEATAKPWLGPFDLPERFEFELLKEDLEQVRELFESAHHRVPVMAGAGIRKVYNGPESFTPDGNPILGRAPEVANVFVGAGFNSAGIALAGGSGRALAEWIVSGRPQRDLTPLDIMRFGRHDDNGRYLRARVIETLGMHYAMPWPNRRYESARPLRRSPVHHLLDAKGAAFGSDAGWEVPYVFGDAAGRPQLPYSFGWAPWMDTCAEEQRAAGSAVVLFDHTARGTFLLNGRDAGVVVADLGGGTLDVGESVHGVLLAGESGYAGEIAVLRHEPTAYLIATGAGEVTRIGHHLQGRINPAACATVADVTGGFATFTLLGPRTADVLAALLPAGRSDGPGAGAPTGRCELGMTTAWLVPVHLGSIAGRQVVVSAEFAVTLFESLVAAGEPVGLRFGGSAAWEALRVTAAQPAWGRELTGAAHADPSRSLVRFQLLTPDVVLWGGEPVRRNGVLVGHLTSGVYAEAARTGVGLGFVTNDSGVADERFVLGGMYSIEVGGACHAARPQLTRNGEHHAHV